MSGFLSSPWRGPGTPTYGAVFATIYNEYGQEATDSLEFTVIE